MASTARDASRTPHIVQDGGTAWIERDVLLHVAEVGPHRAAMRIMLHPEGVAAVKIHHAANHLWRASKGYIGMFVDGSHTTHHCYSRF